MKFSKNANNKKCTLKIIFLNEKDSDNFWHKKLTLKVRILHILMTLTQVTARLKKNLMGWLLVFGLVWTILIYLTNVNSPIIHYMAKSGYRINRNCLIGGPSVFWRGVSMDWSDLECSSWCYFRTFFTPL